MTRNMINKILRIMEYIFRFNNYLYEERKKYIIDGQQRLTTITLLLIYIRHRINDEDQKANLLNLIYSYEYGKKSFKY